MISPGEREESKKVRKRERYSAPWSPREETRARQGKISSGSQGHGRWEQEREIEHVPFTPSIGGELGMAIGTTLCGFVITILTRMKKLNYQISPAKAQTTIKNPHVTGFYNY